MQPKLFEAALCPSHVPSILEAKHSHFYEEKLRASQPCDEIASLASCKSNAAHAGSTTNLHNAPQMLAHSALEWTRVTVARNDCECRGFGPNARKFFVRAESNYLEAACRDPAWAQSPERRSRQRTGIRGILEDPPREPSAKAKNKEQKSSSICLASSLILASHH